MISIRVTRNGSTFVATAKHNGKKVQAEGSSWSKAINALLKLVGLITVFTAIAFCFNSCATEHTLQSVCQFTDGTSSDTITFPYRGFIKKDTLVTVGTDYLMKTWSIN